MEMTITLTRDESLLLLSPLLAEIKFYRSLIDKEVSNIMDYYPDCTIEKANKIIASHRSNLRELESLFIRIFGHSPDINLNGGESDE